MSLVDRSWATATRRATTTTAGVDDEVVVVMTAAAEEEVDDNDNDEMIVLSSIETNACVACCISMRVSNSRRDVDSRQLIS